MALVYVWCVESHVSSVCVSCGVALEVSPGWKRGLFTSRVVEQRPDWPLACCCADVRVGGSPAGLGGAPYTATFLPPRFSIE